jgi:hypothetical protein
MGLSYLQEFLASSCYSRRQDSGLTAEGARKLAWTCCDYADLLLDRKSPGDEERAMTLLDESLELSRDLGMVPLMERVLSRRKILKA